MSAQNLSLSIIQPDHENLNEPVVGHQESGGILSNLFLRGYGGEKASRIRPMAQDQIDMSRNDEMEFEEEDNGKPEQNIQMVRTDLS